MGGQGRILVGVAAGLLSVAIGVGWQIATRAGVTSTLTPVDLAILRYGVPALVLSPLWWRAGLIPKGVDRRVLGAMILGAGVCFGLLGMAGAQFAPAAHMGALLPASMPIFVGVMAFLVLGEPLPHRRLVGFALIVTGILAIALPSLMLSKDGAWRGHLLFLAASLLWSIYTVAFRKSGLSPWVSSAIIAAWSFPAAVVVWLVMGMGRLMSAPMSDIWWQFVWQGLIAGVGGLGAYAVAVRNLGASSAAAFGALVPVAAALGGRLVLGEALEPSTITGVILTSAGVAAVALLPAKPS